MNANQVQHLFTEFLPFIGQVPLSKITTLSSLFKVFYIPECNERKQLEKMIESHGGILAKVHECCTYQISPVKVSHMIIMQPNKGKSDKITVLLGRSIHS